jgi:HPt (histidine-containing phosphotransfer) domain-containing protein
MNDHITKPIERPALLATLRKWLPRNVASSEAPSAAPPASEAAAIETPQLEGIDVADALARLGLEFASLRKMLIRFADGQRKTFDDLRAAVAAGDSNAAGRHAHAIAGAAGNLGARELRVAAKALETAARDGESQLQPLLDAIDRHAAVVFRSIDTLRATDAAPAQAATAPHDPAKLNAGLQRLAAALADFDLSVSEDALTELAAVGASGTLAGELAKVRELVELYEFDSASTVVADLLRQSQTTG